MRPQRLLYGRRLFLALGAYLLTGIACSAGEAIRYPIAIPDGCFALAQREGYPTVIANRWEGAKARAKLAQMKDSDPLVHQCKDAVSQAVADYRAAKE
jgi:hypothetical protein